jgi:TRAP-type C4-dicarboxylate transport system substrate-binding protein
MKDFKFAEICKYITMTGTVIYPFAVVMNKAKWDSLPKDVQKVMDGLIREHSEWTGAYMDKHIIEAVKWSKETQGVEVINLPDAQMAEWNKLLDPITARWIKSKKEKGYPAEAIVNDINAFMKKSE